MQEVNRNDYATYSKYALFETATDLVLLAYDKFCQVYALITFNRGKNLKELCFEGGETRYSKEEVNRILDKIAAKQSYLTKITDAYGLVGFIKFLQGYYAIVITKRKKVCTKRQPRGGSKSTCRCPL
eukprot:GHVQ01003214.1.p1 GENE.GHVQ01003214.1~~GHVQ01003214.1.p1  ORF type:complete len:127 (+),score=7.24 GHVQ01003214.1:135-515(+)